MNFNLPALVRNNIKKMQPYSSARHEFSGNASIFLDANENAYGSPVDKSAGEKTAMYNRYPDPLQWQLKFQLAGIKGVPAENICLGNGSDELIDLAIRIFCNPGVDNVIVCPPTYGMYAVNAAINDVETRKIFLTNDFQLDIAGILNATDDRSKLLFICSPNNPTGNNMNRNDVEFLMNNFPGIVMIDEAYINYSNQKTFTQELSSYPNLIVMQTLSKAWGLAGLRLGMCFASLDIIDLFNKIKQPYNISEASQVIALKALQNSAQVNGWIREVVDQKKILGIGLNSLPFIINVFPSDANFILIKVRDGNDLYRYLTQKEIVVRNRTSEPGCENCLRISIGRPEENEKLLAALKNYET